MVRLATYVAGFFASTLLLFMIFLSMYVSRPYSDGTFPSPGIDFFLNSRQLQIFAQPHGIQFVYGPNNWAPSIGIYFYREHLESEFQPYSTAAWHPKGYDHEFCGFRLSVLPEDYGDAWYVRRAFTAVRIPFWFILAFLVATSFWLVWHQVCRSWMNASDSSPFKTVRLKHK